MDFQHLKLSISDKIALVEIDRPPVNALNSVVINEISEMFLQLGSDPDVNVVIFTGSGKAFIAGADISEMQDMTPGAAEEFSERGQNAMRTISSLSKPVIAAINGFALGGGCELALACDIRYAGPNAKLGQPEVKLGVIPGFGGTARLPRTVSPGIARELIYSGRVLAAEEAFRIGLVDRIVDPGTELLNEANKLAAEIATCGPAAVSSAKRLINDGSDVPLSASLTMERTAFSELFGTHDQKEGMKAFLEKREPKFKRGS